MRFIALGPLMPLLDGEGGIVVVLVEGHGEIFARIPGANGLERLEVRQWSGLV